MDAPTVSMDVRHVASGTAVVDIAGEVTSACEPVLMSAYEQISGNDTQRVVLNFSGLEYMNSGGIGMLVTLLVRTNRQRQQLAAYGLSAHFVKVFTMVGITKYAALHRDEATAIASL